MDHIGRFRTKTPRLVGEVSSGSLLERLEPLARRGVALVSFRWREGYSEVTMEMGGIPLFCVKEGRFLSGPCHSGNH